MSQEEPVVILLLEDDPAHAEAVRRALKASGMNVVIQAARSPLWSCPATATSRRPWKR